MNDYIHTNHAAYENAERYEEVSFGIMNAMMNDNELCDVASKISFDERACVNEEVLKNVGEDYACMMVFVRVLSIATVMMIENNKCLADNFAEVANYVPSNADEQLFEIIENYIKENII